MRPIGGWKKLAYSALDELISQARRAFSNKKLKLDSPAWIARVVFAGKPGILEIEVQALVGVYPQIGSGAAVVQCRETGNLIILSKGEVRCCVSVYDIECRIIEAFGFTPKIVCT